MQIKDLEENQRLDPHQFLIKSVSHNTARNGSEYIRLTLADNTGELTANIWNDNIKNCPDEALEEGKVVDVWGKVDSYNDSLQVVIDSMGVAKEGSYNLDDFIQSADEDGEKLWADLEAHIDQIEDKDLKGLISLVFEDENLREGYKVHPAAMKMHHAFRYGLLLHVLEMIDLAKTICKYYPESNEDLIVTACILHDIGKLTELSNENNTIKYTQGGKLLGHIVQGVEFLNEIAPDDFPAELLIQLKHIILSHHGILEYGSPVIPKTIDAQIVSQVDDTSSQVRMYQRILREDNSDEEFTKRDYVIGTDLYKGPN